MFSCLFSKRFAFFLKLISERETKNPALFSLLIVLQSHFSTLIVLLIRVWLLLWENGYPIAWLTPMIAQRHLINPVQCALMKRKKNRFTCMIENMYGRDCVMGTLTRWACAKRLQWDAPSVWSFGPSHPSHLPHIEHWLANRWHFFTVWLFLTLKIFFFGR